MDSTDQKILSILQRNARTPSSEIARQVGLAPSCIHERLKKLEERGLIVEYAARLNAEALNLGLIAFVFVTTDEPPGGGQTSSLLAEFPEILEVHHVAGEDCYLLKVRLKSNKDLALFLREKIGPLPHVTHTRSVIVLETIKESSHIHIEDQPS